MILSPGAGGRGFTARLCFGQNVSELVFGVDVFDLDLGVQINSIKQPIKSNSVSPGNMSHCRTLHLIIILITASLSSNTYNKASWRAGWTLEGTESMSRITSFLF